jgi:hypothetical protein
LNCPRETVDSSGFSTSRHVRWFDEKYSIERSGHDWVKVHLMCGVNTNVVTAVEIRERDAEDCPLCGPLVRTTARHFKIKEVSADKAYLSTENLATATAVGATPFPLLLPQPSGVPRPLPQALERRIDLFYDPS